MAVPKRKTSKARKRLRRTHKDRITPPNIILCANPECGAPMLAHHACPECGTIRRRKGDLVQAIIIEEEESPGPAE
jgi:large subunit ribosomal protein L32